MSVDIVVGIVATVAGLLMIGFRKWLAKHEVEYWSKLLKLNGDTGAVTALEWGNIITGVIIIGFGAALFAGVPLAFFLE